MAVAVRRVGIFGLGEAGSEIAAGLAERGVTVRAFDPASVPTPPGVDRHAIPQHVVRDVDVVLSVTAAADAGAALQQAIDDVPPGTLYADLSTSSAGGKQALGSMATAHGLRFVDVALMATVPGKGIRTPQLASGDGAGDYAGMIRCFGATVQVVGDQPGDAATRKLLRSIVTKGLAALLLEARAAGRAAGLEDWLWRHLVETISSADEALMRRLTEGQAEHAVRRQHEMEACATLLEELAVPSTMTAATAATLRQLASGAHDATDGEGLRGG